METVKVLGKGQIVIPAEIRKKYKIQSGSHIRIFEYGDLIYLVPPSEDPVNEAMGLLPAKPSLARELLEERRKDFSS
ncbi:Transcriptional regulator, AbrB family [uncultured Desulfobacterium sp.]|uniref:Transcriptional regulator, AbrB family n=1 Tax=uncultured Desulfobacterium sp. TaxID=201089 RepID=A0A445N2P2_9BACT|nr:Transcriptional regulator, AbrB family [uncultured Desulfobacterium sp.]